MRSNPAHELVFIFQLENILPSNLNFSTSYGRLTDLKSLLGLLLVSFNKIWLGENNFTKIFTLRGGPLSPHVQTVSTTLMSKLVKDIEIHSINLSFEKRLNKLIYVVGALLKK